MQPNTLESHPDQRTKNGLKASTTLQGLYFTTLGPPSPQEHHAWPAGAGRLVDRHLRPVSARNLRGKKALKLRVPPTPHLRGSPQRTRSPGPLQRGSHGTASRPPPVSGRAPRLPGAAARSPALPRRAGAACVWRGAAAARHGAARRGPCAAPGLLRALPRVRQRSSSARPCGRGKTGVRGSCLAALCRSGRSAPAARGLRCRLSSSAQRP